MQPVFGPELLTHGQLTAVIIVTIAALGSTVIAVTATLATVWGNVITRRSDAALKSEMLQRGMSAEEIVAVVRAEHAPRPTRGADLPFASEALADLHGEWQPALVLRADGGRYLVHFVGYSMDENTWLGGDRLRFPTGSPLAHAGWSNFGPGAPVKQPREQEV